MSGDPAKCYKCQHYAAHDYPGQDAAYQARRREAGLSAAGHVGCASCPEGVCTAKPKLEPREDDLAEPVLPQPEWPSGWREVGATEDTGGPPAYWRRPLRESPLRENTRAQDAAYAASGLADRDYESIFGRVYGEWWQGVGITGDNPLPGSSVSAALGDRGLVVTDCGVDADAEDIYAVEAPDPIASLVRTYTYWADLAVTHEFLASVPAHVVDRLFHPPEPFRLVRHYRDMAFDMMRLRYAAPVPFSPRDIIRMTGS